MRLFIANCTRQKKRIFFRLDFDGKGVAIDQKGTLPKHQDIDPGKQEPVAGSADLNEAQVNSIIKQLSKYGMQHYENVNRLAMFTDFLYSKDKPVPVKALEKCYQHNQGILSKEGRNRREQAAVASAHVIDQPRHQQDGTDVSPVGGEVRVAIEQVTDSEFGGSRIEEGFTVDRASPAAKSGGSKRAGRNRATRGPGDDA